MTGMHPARCVQGGEEGMDTREEVEEEERRKPESSVNTIGFLCVDVCACWEAASREERQITSARCRRPGCVCSGHRGCGMRVVSPQR